MANNLLPYLTLYELGPAVVSSDPAQGQVVTTTPPTTFSLTFSEPIVAKLDRRQRLHRQRRSRQLGFAELRWEDDHLHVQHVARHHARHADDGAARRIGDRGPRRTCITPPRSRRASYYVNTQLQVTATSPPVGSVFTIPGNIDLVVQFNKPFNPYTITTSDFEVSQGTVASAVAHDAAGGRLDHHRSDARWHAHPDDSTRGDS